MYRNRFAKSNHSPMIMTISHAISLSECLPNKKLPSRGLFAFGWFRSSRRDEEVDGEDYVSSIMMLMLRSSIT